MTPSMSRRWDSKGPGMKVAATVLAVCFSCVCGQTDGGSEKKLLLVQILWRHGDRAATHLYPNDPNHASAWPEGLGKLTQLGKKQHYTLGKFFRSMYSDFVTSNPNEVSVNSTDYDRTIRSALANLASFYAPTPQYEFEPGVAFQPIPVFYLPRAVNKYLATESTCAKSDEEKHRLVHSPRGQKYNKKYQQVFDYYTFHSGYQVSDWRTAWNLQDTLLTEKIHNLAIPYWADPYWKQLTQAVNEGMFEMYNSPLLHRLRAGPFIGLMIENMQKKATNQLPELKVQIYSAHDDTIAVVLSALKLFDKIMPPYCASVIAELYEMPNRSHAFRLLYQNSTRVDLRIDPPRVLVVPGCSEYCSLEYFARKMRHLVPEDWDGECENNK